LSDSPWILFLVASSITFECICVYFSPTSLGVSSPAPSTTPNHRPSSSDPTSESSAHRITITKRKQKKRERLGSAYPTVKKKHPHAATLAKTPSVSSTLPASSFRRASVSVDTVSAESNSFSRWVSFSSLMTASTRSRSPCPTSSPPTGDIHPPRWSGDCGGALRRVVSPPSFQMRPQD
ncbi:hypothetical protein DFH09DRAFT_1121808, partial [Mycena vulgaris]